MRLTVAENDQLVARLSHEQGRRLADSGVVQARPSPFDTELWELAPQGKVGVARVGDVEVWVTPKLVL